jgi:catechol 2,3-dioxygenase-like lactoylglutathione lyase family enzyme
MTMRVSPRIVPELIVTDIAVSRMFWCDVLGYRVLWERPGFAYLERDGGEIMLDQWDREAVGSPWVTGPLERPFGRGINFEIAVDDLDAEIARLNAAGVPFRLPPEEKWYQTGAVETGVRQLMILDPDGYLVRLQQTLGERPLQC